MNQTCTWIHGMELCGKPAVEHVDLPAPGGGMVRIYLCADHADMRDEVLGKHSREERIDRAIKRFEKERK